MDPLIQALIAQAMQQDNGTAGLEQELLAYEAMGPEGFKQMTGMGTLDQRGELARQNAAGQLGMLGQQMEQAQAFAKPVGKDYGTVAGNIGGGLGDALRQFAGGMKVRDLATQQKDLLQNSHAAQSGILDQQDAGRLAAGTARYDAMQKFLARQQQPKARVPAPATGFGLPGLTLDPTLFGG